MITDLYIDSFKFRGRNVKGKIQQLMSVLENYTFEGLVEFFSSSAAWQWLSCVSDVEFPPAAEAFGVWYYWCCVISVQSLHCKSAVDMSPVQNVSACIEGPCRWHCRCHYYYEYINVMLSLCSFWLCVCCAVTDAALHSFAVRFESYGFIFIGQSLFALAKTGLKTKYIKGRVGQCWHLWFGQFLDAD